MRAREWVNPPWCRGKTALTSQSRMRDIWTTQGFGANQSAVPRAKVGSYSKDGFSQSINRSTDIGHCARNTRQVNEPIYQMSSTTSSSPWDSMPTSPDAYTGDFSSSSSNGARGANNPFDTLTNGAPQFDIGTVAPVFGIARDSSSSTANYLPYDIRGRSYSERMMYNTGTSYLLGILGGGLYGTLHGYRESPSHKFKIKLNSVLNGGGKYGSRAGNGLGSLAIFYSSFEALADHFEIDRAIAPYEPLVPIAAAAATGALYKATSGPRPMILASVLGAGLMTVATGITELLHM